MLSIKLNQFRLFSSINKFSYNGLKYCEGRNFQYLISITLRISKKYNEKKFRIKTKFIDKNLQSSILKNINQIKDPQSIAECNTTKFIEIKQFFPLGKVAISRLEEYP